ncbi:MAG: YbaK/EbsC family protein [Eubacteriales bacterium]|nr:YbaK/EbsC family protein [Eubacteriales bacterium]
MSFEKASEYLRKRGLEDRILRPEASSATVELAAAAIGVTPGEIAKTLSFITKEGPVLVIAEGTAKVDNRKYKDTFHTKAKMIGAQEVEALIGHAPGGVCPFGINEGVPVYMDESLRKYEVVYPAAGDDHSAVRLTVAELESASGAIGWVDVCK